MSASASIRADALHVAQISFFLDPAGREPEHLLRAWPSLVDVAECARRAGARVTVIQASGVTRALERGGISYHFLPFGRMARHADGGRALAAMLRELAPSVLHVHGLGFARDVNALARLAPHTPIVLQDHADRVPRFWRRAAARRAAARVAGVAFCARAQALPFMRAGLIEPRTSVYEIPESTSRFTPGDQAAARAATSTDGEPLVLWVGHLDENKDPLAVLAGISAAARVLPGLKLWCCFAAAPLLQQVRQRIETDEWLRGRVQLLGRMPHERIEQLMRAADYFVLGSHREGSGYSLIEALACGVTPVVTDIPSFRALTAGGTVGKLWPCGEPRALAAALEACVSEANAGQRAAVRAHFEAQLSFEAVGRKLVGMYEDVAARWPRRCAPDRTAPPVAPAARA